MSAFNYPHPPLSLFHFSTPTDTISMIYNSLVLLWWPRSRLRGSSKSEQPLFFIRCVHIVFHPLSSKRGDQLGSFFSCILTKKLFSKRYALRVVGWMVYTNDLQNSYPNFKGKRFRVLTNNFKEFPYVIYYKWTF